MFTHHVIVPPARPYTGAFTLEASRICDHIIAYTHMQNLSPKNPLLPVKTCIQE